MGVIQQMHDTMHYNCTTQKDLKKQLSRLGLQPPVSRYDVAQRIKEIESRMQT